MDCALRWLRREPLPSSKLHCSLFNKLLRIGYHVIDNSIVSRRPAVASHPPPPPPSPPTHAFGMCSDLEVGGGRLKPNPRSPISKFDTAKLEEKRIGVKFVPFGKKLFCNQQCTSLLSRGVSCHLYPHKGCRDVLEYLINYTKKDLKLIV